MNISLKKIIINKQMKMDLEIKFAYFMLIDNTISEFKFFYNLHN